jgi:hypothetical protein
VSASLWQASFLSFALVLVLFELVRGWRLGVVRQLVRVLALVAAYGSAFFAGPALLPILRPFLRAPDIVLSLAGGAILALLVYGLVNAIGAVLFKRTAHQPAGPIRFLYGLTGAAFGIGFGLFDVWLVVIAIRSLGAITGTETQAASPAGAGALAHLKESIERGSLGQAVKTIDLVPTRTYETLGKLGSVASNPGRAERFLSCPGAKELTENPRIVALRNDPEIIDLIQQQRYLELLQNPKLSAALNDPALAAQVRSFDFERALDYALKRN